MERTGLFPTPDAHGSRIKVMLIFCIDHQDPWQLFVQPLADFSPFISIAIHCRISYLLGTLRVFPDQLDWGTYVSCRVFRLTALHSRSSISGFLGFWISGFSIFSISEYLDLWISEFLDFSISRSLSFLNSRFLHSRSSILDRRLSTRGLTEGFMSCRSVWPHLPVPRCI